MVCVFGRLLRTIMAELFESYAADLKQLHTSAAAQIAAAQSAGPEERRTALRKAQQDADEADELLGQMDIEVQGFPQSVRARYAAQVREMRAQVDDVMRSIVCIR